MKKKGLFSSKGMKIVLAMVIIAMALIATYSITSFIPALSMVAGVETTLTHDYYETGLGSEFEVKYQLVITNKGSKDREDLTATINLVYGRRSNSEGGSSSYVKSQTVKVGTLKAGETKEFEGIIAADSKPFSSLFVYEVGINGKSTITVIHSTLIILLICLIVAPIVLLTLFAIGCGIVNAIRARLKKAKAQREIGETGKVKGVESPYDPESLCVLCYVTDYEPLENELGGLISDLQECGYFRPRNSLELNERIVKMGMLLDSEYRQYRVNGNKSKVDFMTERLVYIRDRYKCDDEEDVDYE